MLCGVAQVFAEVGNSRHWKQSACLCGVYAVVGAAELFPPTKKEKGDAEL